MNTEGSITDIKGIKVGHWSDRRALTGCTVVIPDAPAVAGVDVRGAAPGTRETELLRPGNLVQHVHAICLAGGNSPARPPQMVEDQLTKELAAFDAH